MVRLTREQVRAVDRLAAERYAVPTILLMENAARAAADAAEGLLGERRGPGPTVLIVCGGGNNGGDGLAVARHLHNRGRRVSVAFTVDPQTYQGDARVNWRIVQAMALPAGPFSPRSPGPAPSLVVDAVFGTGLTRAPRDPFPEIAAALNACGAPVLAIDVPSGLDCDTGLPLGPACVRASATITFVAEKVGFENPAAGQYLGKVIVGDIGCPRELIDRVRCS